MGSLNLSNSPKNRLKMHFLSIKQPQVSHGHDFEYCFLNVSPPASTPMSSRRGYLCPLAFMLGPVPSASSIPSLKSDGSIGKVFAWATSETRTAEEIVLVTLG